MRVAVTLLTLFFAVVVVRTRKGVFLQKEPREETTNRGTGSKESKENIEKIAEDITKNFLKLSKPDNGKPPALDLVFALDASNDTSVKKSFDYQRELVRSLIVSFSISPSGTRVSIASCRWPYSHVNFNLNSLVNKECVMAWIPTLRYETGHKALGRCLVAVNGVFEQNVVLRSNSKKVLFIVSTGKSWSGIHPKFPTKWLKKHGVEIFGLTISHRKDGFQQLRDISSNPKDEHVFWVKEFKDIPSLSKMLRGKGGYPASCRGNRTFYDECERMCSCVRGRPKQCGRVRKDFLSMKKDDRIRFIKVLKTAATKEPFRSQFLDLASTYRKYFHRVRKRIIFLPWHRAFLLRLENLLLQIDCRITLPYWDWSRTSGNPWELDNPDSIWSKAHYGLGGNGTEPNNCVTAGPFRKRHWNITMDDGKTTCLKRHFHGSLPDPQKIQTVLSLPWEKFSDFEKMLRATFHHSVACGNIGGHVCSEEAAQTPEFILITSFVDKLWGQWQNISDFHRDTGYPIVGNNLPGFYLSYVGDVLRLDRQPGCVSIIYDKARKAEGIKCSAISSKGD